MPRALAHLAARYGADEGEYTTNDPWRDRPVAFPLARCVTGKLCPAWVLSELPGPFGDVK